jgi:hypothetical protein
VRTPDDAATTQNPGANSGADHEKYGIGLAAGRAKPRFTKNRGVAVALDSDRNSERSFQTARKRYSIPTREIRRPDCPVLAHEPRHRDCRSRKGPCRLLPASEFHGKLKNLTDRPGRRCEIDRQSATTKNSASAIHSRGGALRASEIHHKDLQGSHTVLDAANRAARNGNAYRSPTEKRRAGEIVLT